MWQLVINGPGYFDTSYDLPEGITSLGRAEDNDIVLSGDLVSRRHARLQASGGELLFEDLGSRNGSRLNGQPLQGTAALRPGDTVNVGENTFAIRQPAMAENARTEAVEDFRAEVRRYGQGEDVAEAVILAKQVGDSSLLQLLDNVPPFDTSGPFAEAEPTRAIAYQSLWVLYRVAEKLSTAPTLEAFLQETIDLLMERASGTTAVVLLHDSVGALVPAAVRHRGALHQGEVPVSDGVIDEAMKKGAALAVAVRDDLRFAKRESVILYGVDQVLCVPLGQSEPFAGVLYLNRAGGKSDELEPLLDLCTAVAHLVAAGVEKFHLREGNPSARLRYVLERHHGPQVLQRSLSDLATLPRPTQLRECFATALFANLAGFTSLSSKLPPERTLELLTEFRQHLPALVYSFGGTVLSFRGDQLLAIFGAPYSFGDDSVRAVRAALSVKAEWEKVSSRHPARERCQLKLGLHSGKVLAGVAGPDSRLDYVALGEPVNVANWLCGSAEPGQVLITGKTLATVGARFEVTPLGERSLAQGRHKGAAFLVLAEDPAATTKPGIR